MHITTCKQNLQILYFMIFFQFFFYFLDTQNIDSSIGKLASVPCTKTLYMVRYDKKLMEDKEDIKRTLSLIIMYQSNIICSTIAQKLKTSKYMYNY